MGYRSEVCIRIKQSKVTDEFKEEIKKGFMPVDYTDGDEWFELYGDYWKWYEDEYDEVKHVMNYLKKLSYEDYGYIRLGDDYGDVEFNGDFYSFNMGINRSIER